MTSPSTADDVSQAMSESFLHLSQNDTDEVSLTQDDFTNTYHTNDISMYLKMAQSLDKKDKRDKKKDTDRSKLQRSSLDKIGFDKHSIESESTLEQVDKDVNADRPVSGHELFKMIKPYLEEWKEDSGDDSILGSMEESAITTPPQLREYNDIKLELQKLKQQNEQLAKENAFLKNDSSKYKYMMIKKDNEELSNENAYLNNQIKQLTKQQEYEREKANLEIEKLTKKIGNPTQMINESNLEPKFNHYYKKLQLYKLDHLSNVELSNIIKNIMLSLLITDFNNLPLMMSKLGKYVQITNNFIDQLHHRVYNNNTNPSMYLRQMELDLKDLQLCLNDLLNKYTWF